MQKEKSTWNKPNAGQKEVSCRSYAFVNELWILSEAFQTATGSELDNL